MLARLATALEARLELALARRYDQHADVGLGGAGRGETQVKMRLHHRLRA